MLAWFAGWWTSSTGRSQRVRVNGVFSDVLHQIPTGVASSPPLLFVFYANDCQSPHDKRHIIKFADDCVIGVPPQQWRLETWYCNEWFYWLVQIILLEQECGKNKRRCTTISPVVMNNRAVELVQLYRYISGLSSTINCALSPMWILCKKAHQCMHFYRKLRTVDTTFMKMFYSCFIQSVLF